VAGVAEVAAREVAAEGLPLAQRLASGFGLPPAVVATLRLDWDGRSFQLVSRHPDLSVYEYGDGKRPPMAPLRKTMNRLRAQLSEMLDDKLQSSSLFPEVEF
jgi:hypothetical protein